MKNLIWQKGHDQLDDNVLNFTAGEDVILDRVLFPYDITASQAHVRALARIAVLTQAEADTLCDTLDTLNHAFEQGDFVLDERFEDGHSAIESYLIEKLGETGKKIHTGRSRNDQVLVATRLYLKAALSQLRQISRDTAEQFLKKAHQHQDTPMPGFTHLQHGTVSSAAHWFAGFAEAFLDNTALAEFTANWIDANPMGTTAGYGVNLALDRDWCTEALGFQRTQINPMYAQNSRGKYEIQVLMAFGQALQDLRRFAWDLSLFCTSEFDFVRIPDRFTTGSSFMPNKRNPDVIELMRATVGTVFAAITELQSLLSLPSGYHRDLQNTKGPIITSISKGLSALRLLPCLVEELELKPETMAAAIDPAMFTADHAIELSKQGIPFRDAYVQALSVESDKNDALISIKNRISAGAPGNLQLEQLEKRLEELESTRRLTSLGQISK